MASDRKTSLMLGGNILGHFTSQEESLSLLAEAHHSGIRAIDTADVYSDGLSETIIGTFLQDKRHLWTISTKVGLASHGDPRGLGSAKTIREKVEGSLKRLKTDYIDIYHLHHFDPITPFSETADCFRSLIEEGKIRAAGISNFQLAHLPLLENSPFSVHQSHCNICISHTQDTYFAACREKNLRLVAYGVLYRGLLHEKYLDGMIPLNSRAGFSSSIKTAITQDFLTRLRQMHQLATDYETSISAIALQYPYHYAPLSHTIVGCRTKKQLHAMVADIHAPLPTECMTQATTIWSGFIP